MQSQPDMCAMKYAHKIDALFRP